MISGSAGRLPTIDEILADPTRIHGLSVGDITQILHNEGIAFTTQPTRGRVKAGTVFVIKSGHKTLQQLRYHPGGGRHVGKYWTISDSRIGKTQVGGPDYYPIHDQKAPYIKVYD